MRQVEIYPDVAQLANAAAQRVLNAGEYWIAQQGFFTLALSGGSTPKPVYELLGKAKSSLDWTRVYLFWGDERCLPPDHPESNYRMVRETLLLHAPVPETNIYRIRGEDRPDLAARRYEDELQQFFQNRGNRLKSEAGEEFPIFDLILLGMGEDGHIASLFPASAALEERQRWVTMVEHDQPPPPLVSRVTLTLPLINTAREVIVLVAGENKAERVRQVLSRAAEDNSPAARLQPVSGRIVWMLDSSAAVRISNPGF